MKKQIKWALDVLNNGALHDAMTTVQDTLECLTHCSECKYFMQRGSTFGYCGRYNCRKLVFDFCSVGEVREEEK